MNSVLLSKNHFPDLDLFRLSLPAATEFCFSYAKREKFRILPLTKTGQSLLARRIYGMAWDPAYSDFLSADLGKLEISFLHIFHDCIHHAFYRKFSTSYKKCPELILLGEALATAHDVCAMASIHFLKKKSALSFYEDYIKLDSYPSVKKRFLEIFKQFPKEPFKCYSLCVEDILSAYQYCLNRIYSKKKSSGLEIELDYIKNEKWVWTLQAYNLVANLQYLSFHVPNYRGLTKKNWQTVLKTKGTLFTQMQCFEDIFQTLDS